MTNPLQIMSCFIEALLPYLHDFFINVRFGVVAFSFPLDSLDLTSHPLVIFRPQRLLHAQRCLTQQMQQAEQAHIVSGNDVFSNPLLGYSAGQMCFWR